MNVDLNTDQVKELKDGDMLIARTINGKTTLVTIQRDEILDPLKKEINVLKDELAQEKKINEVIVEQQEIFKKEINEKLIQIAKIVGGK